MDRFEIGMSDIVQRAQRNCDRDGFQWKQPSGLFELLYNVGKSSLVDDFGRLTYVAEAHWQLFTEALKERDARTAPHLSTPGELECGRALLHSKAVA
jgi:hypothetical protein